MTDKGAQIRRSVVGWILGLSIGFVFVLLVNGFNFGEAFYTLLWALPGLLIVGLLARRKTSKKDG
ncbi:hypothetical protein ABIE37_001300 [Arthrobacter bambusae]|uniref:DUF5668 domain-containing protein n=1 Tax=Arthrobacter bambusae TaxID=1338426 RepID=A0ABV2P444_9MICC